MQNDSTWHATIAFNKFGNLSMQSSAVPCGMPAVQRLQSHQHSHAMHTPAELPEDTAPAHAYCC